MRSLIAIAFPFALGACSILDRIELGGSTLDPSKVYLSSSTPIDVSARDAHRYACVGSPLLCVHRGVRLECRCP